ncbi:MAG: hypothetical protein ACPHK8_07610 [Thermoplasmatota archaeon]
MSRPEIFCKDCGKRCPEYARKQCGPCYWDEENGVPVRVRTRARVNLKGRAIGRRRPTQSDPHGVRS